MKHNRINKLLALCLSCALLAEPVFAESMQITDQTPDERIYSYEKGDRSVINSNEIFNTTIYYIANDGTDKLITQEVSSDSKDLLHANTFKRTGFTFTGWNTKADGSGKQYSNQTAASEFATAETNAGNVALYAQWSLNPLTILQCKAISSVDYKIIFKKNSVADGCQLEYSTNKNFSDKKTISISKKKSSYTIFSLTPGKTYFVRVRSFVKDKKNIYSEWSKVKRFTVPSLHKTKIKSVRAQTIGKAVVTYAASKKASGYQVQYSQKKNFSNSKTLNVSKGKVSCVLKDLASGKQYYVRVRSYFKGKEKTIYSAWSKMQNVNISKLQAPKLRKVSAVSRMSARIEYAKVKNAQKYEIQYSKKKSFRGAKTVRVKGSRTTAKLNNLKPGTRYYIRVRSISKGNEKTYYSKWSNKKSIKTKKGYTINNTSSVAAIEADVGLNGTGSGFHAKLVICTPTSAVSFGIQYDAFAAAPYTGKTMALIENIASNDPGCQKYTRPGNVKLKVGKKYHLMLTVKENGRGNVYINYKKIGSFYNPSMAHQPMYLRIEASGRIDGDTVNASFRNIRKKNGTPYDPNQAWWGYAYHLNPGLHHTIDAKGNVDFYGTITGLGPNGDWDSMYESVSEIIQYSKP